MADSVVTPSVTEAGYVNGRGKDFQNWDEDEKVPDLQWPASVHVFSQMMADDPRVSSVLEAIWLPIISTAWRVEKNGASPEVTQFVADNLGLPIDGVETSVTARSKGRFSWSEHLQDVLLMLPYGHSFFEQIYRLDDDKMYRIRKLAPRPQKTISEVNVALDGGLESIRQANAIQNPLKVTVNDMLQKPIPVSRLVAYVRKREPGVWTGRSMLRPAYKHWYLKNEFMRVQAAAARRNGIGLPVGTAASEDDADEVKKMQKIASASRSGMNSGVGLAKGQTLELMGVTGNLPDIGWAITYHDKAIALAGLAHFLNLDRGGSYNLASVLNDTFVQQENSIAKSIRDTANAHIVEDLVDINFGPDEPAPRIVFDEIGSRQDATAAALAMLVQAGLLDVDDLMKVSIRQKFGLQTGEAEPEPEPEVPAA